ncbi:MAG TPA: hypothetical protein VNI83_12495, partial [Vicinamibacterales bacterium]|nr:hypothetical protein [Vicinamibacterales bacterium]
MKLPLRPVAGLDRPAVQWALVAACAALVVLSAAATLRLRAARGEVRALAAALAEARREQETLERRLARERSAREAFQIGFERVRAAAAAEPVFDLTPGFGSDGDPKFRLTRPEGVAAVRLVLRLPGPGAGPYRAALRAWSGGDPLWVHGRLRVERR